MEFYSICVLNNPSYIPRNDAVKSGLNLAAKSKHAAQRVRKYIKLLISAVKNLENVQDVFFFFLDKSSNLIFLSSFSFQSCQSIFLFFLDDMRKHLVDKCIEQGLGF